MTPEWQRLIAYAVAMLVLAALVLIYILLGLLGGTPRLPRLT